MEQTVDEQEINTKRGSRAKMMTQEESVEQTESNNLASIMNVPSSVKTNRRNDFGPSDFDIRINPFSEDTLNPQSSSEQQQQKKPNTEESQPTTPAQLEKQGSAVQTDGPTLPRPLMQRMRSETNKGDLSTQGSLLRRSSSLSSFVRKQKWKKKIVLCLLFHVGNCIQWIENKSQFSSIQTFQCSTFLEIRNEAKNEPNHFLLFK